MEERVRKIVIAGGGTGGHLYPALAVAKELERRGPVELLFVGAERGIETRLVPQAGYPLLALPLSGLKGAGAAAKARAAWRAGLALLRCIGVMRRRRPELAIGVGGYASGPAMLAARLTGVKTMVLEQNHFPGATNRWLAPRVDVVCVPSEAARARLSGRVVVTGNPVRREFVELGPPPAAARMSLLAFGGSRGARSINLALCAAAPLLAALEPAPRVVHQTGVDDLDECRAAWAAEPGIDACVLPFLDDMPERLAQADLVLCRAGATTLAELAAGGRPALLVPYPHAADDHQTKNAETMVAAGAALLLPDRELDGTGLAALVRELDGDRTRLASMGRAARALARPDAAERIVDLAEELIGTRRAA